MRRYFIRRRREPVYEFKAGLVKKSKRPGIYIGLVLVACLLSANLAIFQAEVAAHASSRASVQPSQNTPLVKAPTQLPTTAPASQPMTIGDDSRLDGIIASFVQSHSQVMWSVSVQGVGTDTITAAYNPSQSFNSASIYKLLIVYPLSQKLPIARWATTQLGVDGRQVNMQDCVTAMLKVSDNDCAVAVGNWVGWSYADSVLHDVGLTSTFLNRANGPVTTAADTAKYLDELWSGNLFDNATRQFILTTLSQQTIRDGIPAGCPGCDVSDKTGDLGSVRHDAGIISAGNKTYILSIFTSGAGYDKIAQLTAQVQAYMASN